MEHVSISVAIIYKDTALQHLPEESTVLLVHFTIVAFQLILKIILRLKITNLKQQQ
jgi:hypothetical protein